MELVSRFFDPPRRSFYLFGPRGTGKSTWVVSEHPDALRIDLLQPDQFRSFKARPERLRERVRATLDTRVCVIDEVQKAQELLDVVHALIEEDPDWIFILTGSSARKLRRGGVDLMAGRAVRRSLHPFMAGELGELFDLEKALRIGMLPLVWDAEDPEDVLSSYADLYLREEVKAEGLVRDLGDFARFLEVISFSHGQVLNISNVARECEVPRKRVEGYIDVLEDLLLCYQLPTFRKRAKRAITKHPKFYLFDSGVFRSLRPAGPLDRPEEIDGAALEGLVGQHLRAWIGYRNKGEKLHFWRTRGGSEVDFVIYGPEGMWAIEVKRVARVQRSELRHLRSFAEDYPESTQILLYRGDERLLIDDIWCVPCEEFLRDLSPSEELLG
jgi:predicted AAA+ superfamily ATPase